MKPINNNNNNKNNSANNSANNMNKTRNNRRERRNRYTMPKRTAWYVMRTALIMGLVVVILTIAFMMAMDAANIYIIVSEGMTLRASCILGDGSPNEMYEYYLPKAVADDKMVQENPYATYEIEAYDYRLNIEGIGLGPFASRATMRVTERIPRIEGRGTASSPTSGVPEWEAGRYEVRCVKVEGRWYIEEVVLIEANPAEEARPTPDMNLLPSTSPA